MELEELVRGAAEGKYRGFQPITKYVNNELGKIERSRVELGRDIEVLVGPHFER